MSLDAIEKVTEIEQQMRELRANADAQVQKVKADAERDGQARLVQARAAAAEEGKALMKKYQSLEAIREATEEDLAQTDSMSPQAARSVYRFFREKERENQPSD